jgi:hypothetical protein
VTFAKTIKFWKLDIIYIYIFLPLVEPVPDLVPFFREITEPRLLANGTLVASAILVYPRLPLWRPPRHLGPAGQL